MENPKSTEIQRGVEQTESSRETKNRLIAEWLGWRRTTAFMGALPFWIGPNGWTNIPDFFASEEASALVLEKLVEIFPYFSICHDREHFKWEVELSGLDMNRNLVITRLTDRKTAIAEAALVLIQQGKEA